MILLKRFGRYVEFTRSAVIFYSKWDETNQEWGEPIQMSYPINTPDDEIHFKLAADGASGYFSSNRVYSRGDFDIFHFEAVPKLKVAGTVLSSKDNSPIEGVNLTFTPHQYINESYSATTNGAGEFELQIFANENYYIQIFDTDEVILEQEMTLGNSFEDQINFRIDRNGNSSMTMAPSAPEVKAITPNVIREDLIISEAQKQSPRNRPEPIHDTLHSNQGVNF